MKRFALLSILAVSLTGCYHYTTHRTINKDSKTCEYDLTKKGNRLFGYWDNGYTSEKRSEKDCKEWLNPELAEIYK